MSHASRPDPRPTERLFISTTPGLEPALDAEVRALGVGVRQVEGGVEVEGPPGLHRRLNLQLRCASRILLRLAEFAVPDYPALEKGLEGIALAPFRTPGVPLEVAVSAAKSKVSHTGRIRDVAARALGGAGPSAAARPPQRSGAAEAEDAAGEGAQYLQLRIHADRCTVSLDTSGELLYRRGYRQEISRAPLRETLGAGMLLLAGYRGDEPVWDPMCGSGTLAIEAALIGLRRAPGISRRFAFMDWPGHDDAAWQQQLDAAKAAERPAPPAAIHATDLHSGSLGTARRNAKRAGVFEHLELERVDVLAPSKVPPEPSGLLITNPPYGMRVGEQGDLPALYAALGALLRRLPGWRAAILVPDARLERALGVEPADAFEVQNGGIRCRLLLVDPVRSGR